jgi:hypothetical protein
MKIYLSHPDDLFHLEAAHAACIYYSGAADTAVKVYSELVNRYRSIPWRLPSLLQDYGRALDALDRHTEACKAYCEAISLFGRLLTDEVALRRYDAPGVLNGRSISSVLCHPFQEYARGIVKLLVLLAHSLLDTHCLADARTAYEYSCLIPSSLKSLSPQVFERFNNEWKVDDNLEATFRQSCDEALRSVRVPLDCEKGAGEAPPAGASVVEETDGEEDENILLKEFINTVCQVRTFVRPFPGAHYDNGLGGGKRAVPTRRKKVSCFLFP